MEYIRRNSDYALRGLAYMAGFPKGGRFAIDEIAAQQHIPVIFLRKIFQKLAQYKIVGSKRGIGGGFYLIKSPSKISINKILDAIQGPVTLSKCIFDLDKCILSNKCNVRKKLKDIQNKLVLLLDRVKLLDLA